MERIEPETEIHRFQKAIRRLVNRPSSDADILFPQGDVLIRIDPQVLVSSGGQLVIALMVNLLARMKTAISNVAIAIPNGIPLHDIVPLHGGDLRDGLIHLIDSLTGPESAYAVRFDLTGRMSNPTVNVAIGEIPVSLPKPDVSVHANAWTAYINALKPTSDWNGNAPFGYHAAATLAVAETFKHLLQHNFPERATELQFKLLDNVEFSALTYGADPGLHNHPEIGDEVFLDNIAIAGLGAGGSAALYSLSCLPKLTGKITLIDPGQHKKSNLSRYLLSNYDDCHTGTYKAETAHTFLEQHHTHIDTRVERVPYVDVQERDFRLIVSTVDTVEGRWDIQRDFPSVILDAAVTGVIYAILRVYPGKGLCLGCKHPYDPDVTWKQSASKWGKTMEEFRRLSLNGYPVTYEDVEHLAEVQGQPTEKYMDLLGMPFSTVPAITECGDTRFNLKVPNQAATLPFVTTMAGILVAAEIVKSRYASQMSLNNWFEHNMLYVPKPILHRFLPRRTACHLCSSITQ